MAGWPHQNDRDTSGASSLRAPQRSLHPRVRRLELAGSAFVQLRAVSENTRADRSAPGSRCFTTHRTLGPSIVIVSGLGCGHWLPGSSLGARLTHRLPPLAAPHPCPAR